MSKLCYRWPGGEFDCSLELVPVASTGRTNSRLAAAVFAAKTALANDPEALTNAAGEGQEGFVRLLLRCQTDLEQHISTAAKTRELTMVRFLLARGAKPTLPDDPPWATPIAWAARRGHSEIVALLEAKLGSPS